MKHFYLVIFLFFAFAEAESQHSNQWINFEQEYFRLGTAADAIYDVTYEQLEAEGLAGVTGSGNLRVYHRGKEVAVLVIDGGDGNFGPGDRIQFFGKRNDGVLDSSLYVSEYAQPHKYFNLYSDSTAFFLTIAQEGVGKRIATSSLSDPGGLSDESYLLRNVRLLNTQRYFSGRQVTRYSNVIDILLSQYDTLEGWSSVPIGAGSSGTYTLAGLTGGQQAGPKPVLKLLLNSANNTSNAFQVLAGPDVNTLRVVAAGSFDGLAKQEVEVSLEWTDISAASSLVVRVTNTAPLPSVLRVPFVEVEYPHQSSLSGKNDIYSLPENGTGFHKLVLPGSNAQTRVWDISDSGQPVDVSPVFSGSTATFIMEGSSQRLLRVQHTTLTPVIKKVKMRYLDPALNDYLVVAHPTFLREVNGTNTVRDFAAYRHSLAGGGLDTTVVDVFELYDQFNYGEVSPMAVYNFVKWMSQENTPDYMMLVGKGIQLQGSLPSYFRSPSNNGYVNAKNLVPTAGTPGSDLMYATELGSVGELPAFPVGRVSAMTYSEAKAYFDKVIELESTPYDEMWRKRLLFLSGGLSSQENLRFFNIVENLRTKSELPFLGGKGFTIRKPNFDDGVVLLTPELIDEGRLMVTFFGHSNPNTIDIELGDVSNYSNSGRYPFLFMNGCDAGFIFGTNRNFSEVWTNADRKGSIGFIGTSHYVRSDNLLVFSNFFYDRVFNDELGLNESVGDNLIHVIDMFRGNNFFGLDKVSFPAYINQVFLMGDPAFKLFAADRPDYLAEMNSAKIVSLTGRPVTAQEPEFGISLIVNNPGKAISQPLKVRVERLLPSGQVQTLDSLLSPVLYSDTITLRIPNIAGNQNEGLNLFNIQLDPDFEYTELNELNNTISLEFEMPKSGSFNLFPYQHSIVNSGLQRFVFQNTDLNSDAVEFEFQLDTTAYFNSSLLQTRQVVSSKIGILDLDLAPVSDSLVYFWRTRTMGAGASDSWSTTSFTYIQGGDKGWSQGNFLQLTGNVYSGVYADSATRKIEFNRSSTNFSVTNYGGQFRFTDPVSGNLTTLAGPGDVSVKIDGLELNLQGLERVCRDKTMNLIAFNSETGLPYLVLGDEDNLTQIRSYCGKAPQIINSFTLAELTSATKGNLGNYVAKVRPGDYVLMFTIGSMDFPSFSSQLKTWFSEFGLPSDLVTFYSLTNGSPFIALGRKGGEPESAMVWVPDVSPHNTQFLEIVDQVNAIRSSGSILTKEIGPAYSWGTFSKSTRGLDIPESDQSVVSIYTRNNNFFTQHAEIENQSNWVLSGTDPSAFPTLQLEFFTRDSLKRTPTQIDRITVTYEPVPDVLLAPVLVEGADNRVQEGQTAKFQLLAINLTPYSFTKVPDDSLKVHIDFKTSDRVISKTFQVKAPAPMDTTVFEVELSTLNLQGAVQMLAEINKGGKIEQNQFNNRLDLSNILTVVPDQIEPEVEIRIDGRRIVNGDLVSSSPTIEIVMSDENRYLIIGDTSLMEMKLIYPGGEIKRVAYSSESVRWKFNQESNRLEVEVTPGYLTTGDYTISVEAKDQAGNIASIRPIDVDFEVINEATVTRFYPYPNPFSDRMRFVFTLTGDELPDELNVRIMTISGRVVRDIGMSEFGPIHIGNNLSEFTWDGTDFNGDRLANGVYLYKVTLKMNGKELPLNSKKGDRGFKNGIGKIYLAR